MFNITAQQAAQISLTNPDTPLPGQASETKFKTNGAVVFDVIQEYDQVGKDLQPSPGWCLAVVRLDRPVTYSRKEKKSVGEIVSGAYQRREKPLIIFDDCIQLSITRGCGASNFIKTANMTLKGGNLNYLSANAILPGDWILAWCHNNIEYTQKIIKAIYNNESVNDFKDGLKFVGRVHGIRKQVSVAEGKKITNYSLQAISFGELDAVFYYDVQLASSVAQSGQDLALYMAQLGINWTNFVSKASLRDGELLDNIDAIMTSFIDIVIGAGGPKVINQPTKDIYSSVGNKGISNGELIEGGRQASVGVPGIEEAPYAYLVPVSVATMLGLNVTDKSKRSVFGYSDILNLITGVQQYNKDTQNTLSRGFWPVLESGAGARNTENRFFCQEHIKGTYLPAVEANMINRPLWQILQQFLNPAINEMYTALKPGPDGLLMPTIVVRQIPFSTNSIKENPSLMLTRFLDLPRWKIDPAMVRGLDIGRSDAYRKNMVRVTGDPTIYAKGMAQQDGWQVMMFPPIFDAIDVARSGLKPHAQVVNMSTNDLYRKDGGVQLWEEAIADWTFGAQNTLNGTIRCTGIQSPITEGDNLELDGVVYRIESITDTCSITATGKTFETIINVSNGISIDQNADYIEDFPVYPGFNTKAKEVGNDSILMSNSSGITEERTISLNNEGA